MLGLAAGTGILAGFARPIVVLVFDPKWLQALSAVRLSLIGAVPTALALFLGVVIESSGAPRRRMWAKTIASAVGLAALVPFSRWWGVGGGAAAIFLLLPALEALLVARLAATPVRRGLVDAAIVGTVGWAVAAALADHAGSLPALVGLATSAGVVTLVAIVMTDHRAVMETFRLLVPERHGDN
jgi:O-antigen/teichoic acid export membrane protein